MKKTVVLIIILVLYIGLVCILQSEYNLLFNVMLDSTDFDILDENVLFDADDSDALINFGFNILKWGGGIALYAICIIRFRTLKPKPYMHPVQIEPSKITGLDKRVKKRKKFLFKQWVGNTFSLLISCFLPAHIGFRRIVLVGYFFSWLISFAGFCSRDADAVVAPVIMLFLHLPIQWIWRGFISNAQNR